MGSQFADGVQIIPMLQREIVTLCQIRHSCTSKPGYVVFTKNISVAKMQIMRVS